MKVEMEMNKESNTKNANDTDRQHHHNQKRDSMNEVFTLVTPLTSHQT